MTVYWHEQRFADVPEDDNWLSPAEAYRLTGLRVPKRRADWRLGRWTAKRAVAALMHPGPPLPSVEIRPAASGAPEVFVEGRPWGGAISLTHREGMAACAVSVEPCELGCDLEVVEERSEAFLRDYFVDEEFGWLRACPAERYLRAAFLWSAKESVMKALQEGLRISPRSIQVFPPGALGAEWAPFETEGPEGRGFAGWGRVEGVVVKTLVSEPACDVR